MIFLTPAFIYLIGLVIGFFLYGRYFGDNRQFDSGFNWATSIAIWPIAIWIVVPYLLGRYYNE